MVINLKYYVLNYKRNENVCYSLRWMIMEQEIFQIVFIS